MRTFFKTDQSRAYHKLSFVAWMVFYLPDISLKS